MMLETKQKQDVLRACDVQTPRRACSGEKQRGLEVLEHASLVVIATHLWLMNG